MLDRKNKLHWRNVERVKVWGVATSVFPKVGVDLISEDVVFWFNEWDAGFTTTFEKLGLESKLPSDWYSRAESGASFVIEITDF